MLYLLNWTTQDLVEWFSNSGDVVAFTLTQGRTRTLFHLCSRNVKPRSSSARATKSLCHFCLRNLTSSQQHECIPEMWSATALEYYPWDRSVSSLAVFPLAPSVRGNLWLCNAPLGPNLWMQKPAPLFCYLLYFHGKRRCV
jgi:hypothetical protein